MIAWHSIVPGLRTLVYRHSMLIMLLALAAFSAWLLDFLNPEQPPERGDRTRVPDFYMEQFSTLTYDVDGQPYRHVRGEHMAHFADTGTSEFVQPRITIHTPAGPPWQVRSERGWASSNEDVLLLLGEVNIWRENDLGRRLMEIDTRDLRVLPDTGYGETDQPVTIRRGSMTSRGVGMRAYLEDDRLELVSQVHTVHERSRD